MAGGRDRHGPGGAGVRARGPGRHRGVGRRRGARPAPALVQQPRGHAGGAAGVDVRPRRPDPDARRLPGRVEQAPRPPARGEPPRGRRARPRRLRGGVRRRRGGLAADPRGVGRPVVVPGRGPGPPDEPPHPDARRLAGRLRAHDPPLVGAGAGVDGGAGAGRPAGVLRLLQPALDHQPRHPDRAVGRGGDRQVRRGARARVPARGARPLPRGPRRGLVGELPLLRGPAVLGGAARAGRRVARPPGGRARGRRHAHLQPGGAARVRAGDRARQARPGRPRPAAGGRRRRAARRDRTPSS